MTTTETTTSNTDSETVEFDVQHIEVGSIDPDPNNRTYTLDKTFLASIERDGVINPVTIITHPETPGRFQMVAGHRRLAAATKAGRATIPAIVRDDLDAVDRVSLQLIENLQREDLTPSQEAAQLLRAITVGHTIKSLATAVGRSQKWVKERLTIAELPALGRKRIDQGNWTIAEGIAAAKFADQPEHFARLTDLAAHRNVGYEVDVMVAEEAFAAEAVKLVEHAEANGVKVVEFDGKTMQRLDTLGIDASDHRTEECHAVVLAGRPPSNPRVLAVCLNKANHMKKGHSTVKLPAKTSSLTEEQRAENAAARDARSARVDAMSAAATGKLAKAAHVSLIETTIVRTASADLAKKALKVLGVEVNKNAYTPTVLTEFADASPANLTKAARAVALVEHNHIAERGWGDEAKKVHKAWQKWLSTHTAWTPTKWDKDQLK